MGRRALPLLLLFLTLAAAAAGSSSSSDSAPAPSAVADHDDGPSPAKDDGSITGSTFTPEAYPVKWNGKDQPPQGDDSSFTPEAYPVKWNGKDQTPQGDDSSFTPEAYPVKWNGKDQPPQGGDSSFTPEAYPVKWNGKDQPPQAPHVETMMPAARGDDHLHVEPGMLFPRKSLFPGAVLPEGTRFGGGLPAPRRFVFRDEADTIPFTYDRLDTILLTFGIPRGSTKAHQVAATLRTCQAQSPEPHTCATSQQAMAQFAASSLGTTTNQLRAVVTVVHGKDEPARYTVAPDGTASIGKAGDAAVACHPMAYPYVVHYCHRPAADVEALRVELVSTAGLGGDATATAVAMCHANTANWDGRYFQMLNATRGEEICHFIPRNYILWLPAAAF